MSVRVSDTEMIEWLEGLTQEALKRQKGTRVSCDLKGHLTPVQNGGFRTLRGALRNAMRLSKKLAKARGEA